MTFAASLPNCDTVIVADQRYSRATRDGQQLGYADHRGKLARYEEAWLTFSGDNDRVIAMLEELSPGQGPFHALALAARTVGVGLFSIVTVDAAGVGRVQNGNAGKGVEIDAPSRDVAFVAPPPGPGADAVMVEIQQLFASLDNITTTYELVRAVASLFARSAEVSCYVSPTIEMAVGNRYLSGFAAHIATQSDARLVAALREPSGACDVNEAIGWLRAGSNLFA